jgi:hypothetical protein
MSRREKGANLPRRTTQDELYAPLVVIARKWLKPKGAKSRQESAPYNAR